MAIDLAENLLKTRGGNKKALNRKETALMSRKGEAGLLDELELLGYPQWSFS